MTGIETFVVVGGGLAAGKAVEALRDRGFDGRVVLVAEERHLPYERPPLSKGYLAGNDELATVFVNPAQWYDDHGVDLRLGVRVEAIDPSAHTVAAGGEELRYDRLLLATGSAVRRLPMADAAAAAGAPVAYLRTIEDSDRIKAVLGPGRRIVVVGGGWIGLEVAASARTAGCDVVVLETMAKPLLRVLGPEVSDIFADLHLSHGVDLRTEAAVEAIVAGGGPEGEGPAVVRLADGSSLDADLVVVGVGVTPRSELAEAAGLKTDNGIVVDEHLRSSDPDVFAVGDVANAYHPRLRRHLRVEHWDNAIAQARVAARTMLGDDEVYDRLPYFFTDQYDLGMEYVGAVGPEGYDEVIVRGDVPGRVFTAFWLRDGQVLAGMHANDWDAIDPVRAIVGAERGDHSRLPDVRLPLGVVVAGPNAAASSVRTSPSSAISRRVRR